jgi:uncharacterized protein YcbX
MSSNGKYKEVGRVVAVHRFPVKSMAGERLEDAHLGWHGIKGDRRLAFLVEDDPSGLPWLSAREAPGVLGYKAAYITAEDVDRGRAAVTTPAGVEMPVLSPDLRHELAQLAGRPLRAVRLHRGAFDAMAVSIISTSSIASVSALAGPDLDPRRFRANIVMSSFDEHPYPEDRWVGELLVFGETPEAARIRINRRDPRCSVVNVDPDTLSADKAVLGSIVRERKNLCGVYGSTERAGTVKVGDAILLRKS